MDKNDLKKIKEQVDRAIKARGIDTSISDFNNKLKREKEEKDERNRKLKEMRDKEERSKDQKEFIDTVVKEIRDIKIENNIEVTAPDVKVPSIDIPNINMPEIRMPKIEIPEIKLPTINVPEPKVTVNVPKIEVPKVIMPKEMEVKGFGSFVKAAFEILKSNLEVKLKGIDKRNPLPVILCDEKGKYYKALDKMMGGGGSSVNGLMNNAGSIINPATADKQDDIITGLITNDPFNGYGLYAYSDDDTTTYVMYQDKDDKWIIMKIVDATGAVTYDTGTSDTATAWAGKAGLDYDTYANKF